MESIDVFAQEDAVEHFLAGETNDDLLLSHVDNENEDIEFKNENVLDCEDLDENTLAECELNGREKVANTFANTDNRPLIVDFKRFRRNSLVNALKKRSIKCLNKMHVMEDVREGSDVPGAQPSSPGHAEQRPGIDEANELDSLANNENSVENDDKPCKKESSQTNGNDNDMETNIDDSSNSVEDGKVKGDSGFNKNNINNNNDEALLEKKEELNDDRDEVSEDDVEENQYAKRKNECEGAPSKRMRSEMEQNYILRDKILNEYVDTSGGGSVHQVQAHMDQILAEIRTLNELAKEKEKEWNNVIHLKKMKEELFLRMQRRKQVMALSGDKVDWNEHEFDNLDEQLQQKSVLKHNFNMNNNSGLVIFSTSNSSKNDAERGLNSKQRNSFSKHLPNTVIEINGGDPKQIRQRPIIDVQSIIADYRQRHPEAVPRRGRRIRTLLNNQGSGSQVKHNLSSSSIEANSELGILLNAMDGAKQTGSRTTSGDSNAETTSFKDVLLQFAKLSQNERQDLLQNAMKPLPYSEVTVHPVPAHTQTASNSLLHGILTKAQTRSENSKSTFSPTLARLLTAPERSASSSPHTNNHLNSTPVSITDMLSNNKARNEITITPVGGQFELLGKEKLNDEEEAEDSADRLVIDEGEALDARNRLDNGSDTGDDVPQCQGCNQKSAQFVCAGCGNQWYCSRECQVIAWDEHSEVCSG